MGAGVGGRGVKVGVLDEPRRKGFLGMWGGVGWAGLGGRNLSVVGTAYML